jgi:hypothetical protein
VRALGTDNSVWCGVADAVEAQAVDDSVEAIGWR